MAACVLVAASAALLPQRESVRAIAWSDLGPLRPRVEATGLTEASFPAYLQELRTAHATRVRDGDFDHLVFYLLQSAHFTTLPPIEPALSAKALVEGLPEQERKSFLAGAPLAASHVPPEVRTRIEALLKALDRPRGDARLLYFSSLVSTAYPKPGQREGLDREYLRAMRFVYQKEFVAQRSAQPAQAVAELYRTRGLSTDTAVEAGYVLSMGLGIVRAINPNRQIRRVLIVGPGLDLAPRTALVEVGPPESYQPWAVIDGLVTSGLSRLGELLVVGADINPRVVAHLRQAHTRPPTLELLSEIRDSDTVTLTSDYRQYFAGLGSAITNDGAKAKNDATTARGHLRKSVQVSTAAATVLSAEQLDIVTERLAGQPFDLIIATNILPYFDDRELALAMVNIAEMLAPGGVFLHNESRPALQEMCAALGLTFVQSRHAVIANVRGATAPLFDSVWIHEKVTEATGK